MWEREEDRLALLELLERGRLRRRSSQVEVWTILDQLPWTRRTGRRDEIELVPDERTSITELLNRVWPSWQVERQALAARQLNPTPNDWRRLQDLLRAQDVPVLPARLNLRTAASSVAPHSKAGLSSVRRAALGETVTTRDGIVRLRPPPGLLFMRDGKELDAASIARVLGEVAITERALLDGTTLKGAVRAVLLVENLGPYQDLVSPQGWLIAHVPGWNTATVCSFLRLLPGVPIIHFGDLDAAGVRIVRHLQQLHPALKWAVPYFWREYIDKRALVGVWPEELNLTGVPPLVLELAQRGLWLEQEAIVVDARLPQSLVDIAD